MKEFNNEEEASSFLKEEKNKDVVWFCPLIISQCNKKCVCFVEASKTIVNYSNNVYKFKVYDSYCSNNMFCGGD